MGHQIFGVFIRRISRAHGSRKSELADRDVVGMSVVTIGRKGDNNLWIYLANMSDDLADRFNVICLIHVTVDIAKEIEPLDAKLITSSLQFPRADLAESFQAWVLLLGAGPA